MSDHHHIAYTDSFQPVNQPAELQTTENHYVYTLPHSLSFTVHCWSFKT